MFKKATKKLLQYRITNVGPTVTNPPKVNQDMPPPEGFTPVRISKNTQRRKFWHPNTIVITLLLAMTYGWWRYKRFADKRTLLKYEQRVLENAITPYLIAEQDIVYIIYLILELLFKKELF
jgi:hypothetical protein